MNLLCQNNSFTLFGFFDSLMTPTGLSTITNSFSDYKNSFANEITLSGPSNAMHLENKEKGTLIILRSNSVVITQTLPSTPQPFNAQIVEDFCGLVLELLSRLFRKTYSGNRVAIRTQCFVLDPKNVYAKHLVSPFSKTTPHDLHINVNDRVSVGDQPSPETINVIRNIDCVKATANMANGKSQIVDSLLIRTDINTVAERSEPRFSQEIVEKLLIELTKQDEKAFNEIKELLDGTEE